MDRHTSLPRRRANCAAGTTSNDETTNSDAAQTEHD
jgi:hypothetical protein